MNSLCKVSKNLINPPAKLTFADILYNKIVEFAYNVTFDLIKFIKKSFFNDIIC